MRVAPVEQVGTPVPSSKDEKPPMIRRTEVVAVALVGLLLITVVAALYVAKPFFLPVIMAFVVGTMLAPAAGFMEKRGVPRAVSAVLIVAAVFSAAVFIIGLIVSPVIEWSGRLPELGAIIKQKLHILDGPMKLWHQLQVAIGGSELPSTPTIQFPQIDWMQPTFEFISPTVTEILLFLVTLVLFIASWKDLRKAMVMTFTDREVRLRTLRILNEIESSLGSYLLTVTSINIVYGAVTGIICVLAGMPNPAGLGALAATLNFLPIIGPFFMFIILTIVSIISFDSISAAMVAPLAFAVMTFIEGHFITPAIIGRRLSLNVLAVFIALAFWTWLWGPMGGFLASPILIVGLVLKEYLLPEEGPNLPGDSP
jgi:predicted PurR-regulated permease PerM